MDRNMNITGISGQAGSGKDTVANYLIEKHNFKKHALADPIKEFGESVFSFSKDQLWGPSEMRNEVDSRYLVCDSPAWEEAKQKLQTEAPRYVNDIIVRVNRRPFALQKLFEWFNWLRENHCPLSPRVMLQTLGTEWGRSVDEDLWVSCLLMRSAKTIEAGAPGVAVSDVRFRNELQALRDVGGKLLRVLRPSTDQNAKDTGVTGHKSEAEQKSFSSAEFDFVVVNDGTLDDLYQKVDDIANQIIS